MNSQGNAAVSLSPYLVQGKMTRQDKGKRLVLNHPPNPTDSMNFIIWNTRGVNSDSFRRHYIDLVKNHNPMVVVLLETKMVDHKNLTEMLKFDSHFESSVEG